jgi:dimethylsulfone monooxygenase
MSSTEPLKFAYWVPNVSGGLVTSTIEQRTEWTFDYNVKLAQLAERVGFEYALSQVRYTASYGADQQHESTSFSLGLLTQTEKLKVIAAVHPGLWHPAVLAKWIITADHISGGRAAVNVVSGWFKDEFTGLGEPWLEHDERYRRSREFIDVLRGLWTEQGFEYRGDFYRIHDFTLKPPPVAVPGRPYPEIFQGGNSTAARYNGGSPGRRSKSHDLRIPPAGHRLTAGRGAGRARHRPAGHVLRAARGLATRPPRRGRGRLDQPRL